MYGLCIAHILIMTNQGKGKQITMDQKDRSGSREIPSACMLYYNIITCMWCSGTSSNHDTCMYYIIYMHAVWRLSSKEWPI